MKAGNSLQENKTSTLINRILLILFLVMLAVFKFRFHEFWKDEWQAWFVATDTSFPSGFWKMLSVEGHPALWFLLLRGASLMPSLAPENLIQGVHFLLMAVVAAFFFLRFRLPVWAKAGLGFSYFFFFEYGVVNRGYVLVMLFLFWLVTLLDNPGKHKVLVPVLLFLLTQTEVYGLFAALSISLLFFQETDFRKPLVFLKANAGILSALAAGVLLFIVSVMPGEGAPVSAGKDLPGPAEALISLLSNTLCIGLDTPQPGNLSMGSLLFSLFLLILIVFVFRRDKVRLNSFLLFSAMFLAFEMFVYRGGPRQWGMYFVFFVALLHGLKVEKGRPEGYAYLVLLSLIILAQLIHNGKILIREKKYLFSNAIHAGEYIRTTIPVQVPVIGINKAWCTPVIGYSRRKFYSLPDRQLFSYAMFREKLYLPSMQDIKSFSEDLQQPELFVISYRPLPAESFKELEPVQAFDEPSIRQESYFLYRYHRNR